MNSEKNQQEQINIAMRVIADHIRTIAFSIADGQLPSNVKAGYVIRRILRRAVRYGYTFLNQNSAFLYKIIPALIENMGEAYPELKAQQTLIERVIKEEEESFLRTLEKGIKMLENEIRLQKENGQQIIDGKVAFELYDTYGFPLDLTELIAKENDFSVDIEGFNAEMQKQKARARNAAAVETDDWVIVNEGDTEFVGYDCNEVETSILRYRKIKQKNEEFYQIVLQKTPFYAEMGGQVGDCGYLTPCPSPKEMGECNTENLHENCNAAHSLPFGEGWGGVEIIDTKKENNLPVHISKKLPNDVNQKFLAKIDVEKRNATARNHSATHILHEALREVLGTHVEQKGSFVSPDSLRFDFSHFQKLTTEEIRKVEHLANQRIRANFALEESRDTPIAKAQQMGAMALFGEKYGDKVRVIKFGNSIELCGGTHVHSTGEIGMVRIVSESSIAAGIRRIEAITGEAVEKLLDEAEDFINYTKEFLHNAPDLQAALRKVIEENADLKKDIEGFVQNKIAELAESLLSQANAERHSCEDGNLLNNITVIQHATELPAEHVKMLAFQLRSRQPENLFAVIGSIFDGKPSLTVLLSDDLVAKGMNAVQIIREAAKEIQGGGGGQPFFAQAGGKNADGVEKAIEKAAAFAIKN